MKHFGIIVVAVILSMGITTSTWAQTGGTAGFENNSVSGFVGGGSSETDAVTSTTVRTGNYSLALSSTSTSTKYWRDTLLYATSGTGPNNIHCILWAKASVASMIVDASMRYSTTLPIIGNNSASNSTLPVTLSTSVWTKVTYTAGNSGTRHYFPGPRKVSPSPAATFYMDDLVMYRSTNSVIDTIPPYAPTNASNSYNGTNALLTWSSGGDNTATGTTGVQATMVLKYTGSGTPIAPTLNNQANYAVNDVPATDWVVVKSDGGASGSGVDVGAISIKTTYALYHRDLAYNWSPGTITIAYDYYKSNGTGGGDWSAATTWLNSTDGGSSWASASNAPTSSAAITIQSSDVVTVDGSVTANCSITSGASIVEASGKYIVGTTTTSQNVGTGSSTLGGIGIGLDAGADDLGTVTVTRVSGGEGIVTSGASTGISRKWTISSTYPPTSGRNLTLTWDAADDNSKTLSSARVWKSTDAGSTWEAATALADLSGHSVTVPVTSFSVWTISDATNALPVEMTSFTASMSNRAALLQWTTAAEINNRGFDVERRAEGSSTWTKIGFVSGAGTSNSPKNYSFADPKLAPGVYGYRLKQIDNGGTFRYSGSTQVDAGVSTKVFELMNNFPNPFNPTTQISFAVPEDGFVTLKMYNSLGQQIAVLFSGMAQAGHYATVTFDGNKMASGVYFARLEYNGKSMVQRMLLTK